MINKRAVAAIVAVVASLLIAGCITNNTASPSPTSTPTSTPVPTPALPPDLSAWFTQHWEGGDGIVTRPFTKSTNDRGNDVYKGAVRRTNVSSQFEFTIVEELARSQSEAKQLYDKAVADLTNEGFVLRPDWVADFNKQWVGHTEVWMGQRGNQQVRVSYVYGDHPVHSWFVTTQSYY